MLTFVIVADYSGCPRGLECRALSGEEMSMAARLRFLNPPTLSVPPSYSQVVEITSPGRLIYIAGQLALDGDGKLVGSGDFRAQAVRTFENLKLALAAVGAGLEDVVKVNNYLVDISHLPIFREIRESYFGRRELP